MKRNTPLKAKTPIRKVSPKRARYRASAEGKAALEYMGMVKRLPCAICRKSAPSEAHHCRHMPDADNNGGMGPYEKLPGAAMKSGDRDTIPLCRECHEFRHMSPADFMAFYGPDYRYIEQTRMGVANIASGQYSGDMT